MTSAPRQRKLRARRGTRIRHENGAFLKSGSNRMNLKTLPFHFRSRERKQFENGAFRKKMASR